MFGAALALVCPLVMVPEMKAQATFDDVIATITHNNPDLQSQYREMVAEGLDNADANALADPSVDFARVWGRHGIGNKLQLDVSQEFEWPGVYGARRRAADMAQQVAMAQYEVARFELGNQAQDLLLELIFVRHQIEVIDDLTDNFKRLNEAIDKGVRGGELTILDQRKMEIENYEIDNDMAAARAREQQIIASLQGMTSETLDLKDIAAYPVWPVLTLDEYISTISQDPALQAQILVAEQERANADVARQSRMPGFTVGYQHQAEMGDRFNGFTVGVTLPVFQNRHARQAAMERREAADDVRQMIITQRTAEMRGLYADMEIQRGRLDAYRRNFGDNKYLDLLLKAYNGGQISVIDYLSELHYYHQTMLTYLESEYNYFLALANLNNFNTGISR